MTLIYNELPSIDEAIKTLSAIDLTRLLSELGQVLIKYGLNACFGIVLVHRHFILAEDEQMVELKDGEKLITCVFTNGIPDAQVVNKFNLHVPSLPEVVGSSLVVTKSGLLAYEYRCTTDSRAREQLEIMNGVSLDFRADWSDVLEKFGMENRFGLIALEDEDLRFRCEESFLNERVSIHWDIVNRGSSDEPMETPTVWYASDLGHLMECRKCQHSDDGSED